MRRRLFTLAAALSFLLCIGTALLWVRSYRAEDGLAVLYGWRYATAASFRGAVGCELGRHPAGGPADLYSSRLTVRQWHWPSSYVPPSDYIQIVEAQGRFADMPHYHHVLGFWWHPRLEYSWEYRERGIAVPDWFLLALSAAAPACWLRRTRRTARGRRRGHCAICGYDLRASTARCPECGRPAFEAAR